MVIYDAQPLKSDSLNEYSTINFKEIQSYIVPFKTFKTINY